ncbi:MAG TPA: alpha/beta fold hydrolase [Actinomycetota bacterium]
MELKQRTPTSIQAAGPATAGRKPSPRAGSDRVALIALGLVALHVADAWLLRPVGDAPLSLRALRLGVAMVLAGAGAIAWTRLRSRRARGAFFLAAGTVAALAGGAISLPRAAHGLGGNQLTGLVVLAAGLVLVGMGLARAVGRRPWWRPVVAFVVGAVLAQFVLFPTALAVYATNPPRPELGHRTPADVGLDAKEVAVVAADGVRLAAWWIPPDNGAAVLLLPGSGSTRDDLLDHAAMLHRHGYGALLLDPRGHGGSEGEPMEFGWGGESDVRAAVDLLADMPGVEPGKIAAFGQSMGGEQAITAAALDDRIRAVVTEGAEVITVEDAARRPAAVGGWPSLPMFWVQRVAAIALGGGDPPAPHSESMAAIAPRPVLLIAGVDPSEVASNRFFHEAGGPNVELWEPPDTPHVGGLRVHPDEYEDRVIEFLDSAFR